MEVSNTHFESLSSQLFDKPTREFLISESSGNAANIWNIADLRLLKTLKQGFDLDSLVLSQKGAWNDIRVANLHHTNFNDSIQASIVTPQLIQTLYANGYSVVVNNLQEKIYSVYRLCQELASIFVAGVNCNAYLTPCSSQALAKHYDDEDVIVLQIDGTKTWKVYTPEKNINPGHGTAYLEDYVESCTSYSEYMLRCGEALYIPKGFPHEAFSTNEDSLHFTFSLHTIDVADIVREIIVFLSSEEIDVIGMRSRISVQWLKEGVVNTSNKLALKKLITSILGGFNENLIERALSSLAEKQCMSMSSQLLTGCSNLFSEITLETILQPNPMQLLTYSPRLQQMHFKGGSIDITDEFLPIVEKIQHGAQFKVSELPGMEDEKKLSLINDLIYYGILHIA